MQIGDQACSVSIISILVVQEFQRLIQNRVFASLPGYQPGSGVTSDSCFTAVVSCKSAEITHQGTLSGMPGG